jgi:hypothetical protein
MTDNTLKYVEVMGATGAGIKKRSDVDKSRQNPFVTNISKLLCSVQSCTALDSATVPQLGPNWANKPFLYRTVQNLPELTVAPSTCSNSSLLVLLKFNSTQVPDV